MMPGGITQRIPVMPWSIIWSPTDIYNDDDDDDDDDAASIIAKPPYGAFFSHRT